MEEIVLSRRPVETETSDLECALWLKNPMLAPAGEEWCARLARRFPAVRHEKGERLAVVGEPVENVLVLHEGVARLYHRVADARETLVSLVCAPALLGHAEVLAGQRWVTCVSAFTDVGISWMPAAALCELVDENPEVARAGLRQVSITACAMAHNQRQVFAMLEQRVANLLLTLAELQDGEDPCVIAGLTMPMIARSLGSIRRTVAKVVAALSRRGLITRRDNGDFVLLEPGALEELARPIRGALVVRADGLLPEPFAGEPCAEVEILEGPELCGQRFPVDRELLIGSHPRCHVPLRDGRASPWHCRLYRARSSLRYWVEDMASEAGTRVDGRRVARAVLRGNEVIEVGETRLVFRVETAPG
jgi:CRP-like cAMP-binding protein